MRPLLLAIGGAGFASAVTMRMLDPLLPTIAREFDRTIDQTALLSVAFTAAYALSQPILGPLGDSLGKLRLVTVSTLLMAAVSVAAAASTRFDMLATLRAIGGAFAGGVIPLAIASYGDLVPVHQRQVALARFMVATVSGQIMGSTFGGFASEAIGWRGVLVAGAGVGLASAVAMGAVSLKPDGMPRKRLSLKGAIEGYATVFRNPLARPLMGLVAIEGLLVYGIFPYVAAVLEHRQGVGAFEAGIVISGFAIGGLIYGIVAGVVVSRLGQAVMAPVGGFTMAAAMAVFATPLPWWVMIGAFTVHGFGFYLIHSTLQTHATEVAPQARGSAMAVFASSLFLGVAIGPLAFGAVSRTFGDSAAIGLVGALLSGVGLVVPPLLKLKR